MPPPRVFLRVFPSQLSSRAYSTRPTHGAPIIHIPKANIYAFGASSTTPPSLRDVEWTVNDGEAWAIVSSSRGGAGKSVLFQTLLGNNRISPPPPSPGLYPFLNGLDPFDGRRLGFVAFRNTGTRGAGGGFYDYTARYGAVRDEDTRTLRESFRVGVEGQGKTNNEAKLEDLVDKLGLTDLMDLPLIALSNGQTIRARIARAVLKTPEVLLLDEPLTGLDPASRSHLHALLEELHASRSPRIILGMRAQEELPGWITHVLDVGEGGVTPRTREGWKRGVINPQESGYGGIATGLGDVEASVGVRPAQGEAKLIVDLKGVGVRYGNRTVLKDISWQIRGGDRWHLQGSNGSGKTTLLSLLTGDHPQSYTQAHLHLPSLSPATSSTLSSITHPYRSHRLSPRKRTPTAHLRTLIGVVSPELFDAFPRRHPGMTVWEAVVTGFGGGFVPLKGSERVGEMRVSDDELGFEFGMGNEPAEQEKEKRRREVEEWRISRCWDVLSALGPRAWSTTGTPEAQKEFASRRFTFLSLGEQRIVLLMRALVSRPPLVLLDEVWSGMDGGMISAVRRYLTEGGGIGEGQAVVVITHWEEEVPWVGEEVRRFRICQGSGGVVE
ncbi:hypothetical protein K443DRAFT_686475 [Laccaria amethystina LaAM-08-1]|uniref:ABC transporter domain-containing protein n=1 Tax=Laccaria amethystina LaAM-08-1 TaxID=1095629 RepID=A0A0C9X2M3_9AGAR|nr:hypothetical protein K443DRAFT_686475 [Laccaria amethystina LaAM-08-1]